MNFRYLHLMDLTIFVLLGMRILSVMAPPPRIEYKPVPPIPPEQLRGDNIENILRRLRLDPSQRQPIDLDWNKELATFLDETVLIDPGPNPRLTGTYSKERIDWKLPSLGDVPYAAVLYDVRPSPALEFSLEEGRACGGIVLTPSRVMTLCACVWQWLLVQYTRFNDDIYRWSIGLNGSAGGSWRTTNTPLGYFEIRVALNKIYFDGSDPYKLSENLRERSQWYQEDCFCLRQLETEGLQQAPLHGRAIIKLEPPIHTQGVYMLWPPPHREDPPQAAQLTGFGFRKVPGGNEVYHDDNGFELVLNRTLVSAILNETCPVGSEVPLTVIRAFGNETECYFLADKTIYKICGGLIGSPVIMAGFVIGTLISPIDCLNKRKAEVRTIYETSFHYIQEKVGKEVLRMLHAPHSPHLREDIVINDPFDYVHYDVSRSDDDDADAFYKDYVLDRGQRVIVSSSNTLILMTISLIITLKIPN